MDNEFKCECIECGYKQQSKIHCKDIQCPECGGQMRREERPGPGQKERKSLTIPFKLKEMGEEAEYYTFTGYASTFGNEDLGNDVVVQGAFTASLKKRMPKLLYQHDVYKPIGVIVSAVEDGMGLQVIGKLPKKHSLAKDVAELIKIGGIDSMSIGYSIVEAELDNQANIRYLTKVDLWETSFVTFAMNERAQIQSMKAVVPFQNLTMADKETGWEKEASIKRLMEWSESGDVPSNKYRKAFLWYDGKDKTSFSAYRFQIADVIDNQLKVIPRALYAAAGAIQSNRGTDGITEEELETIKMNVSKYYKKLDIVAPWDTDDKSSEKIIDNICSIKDVNDFLREKGLSKLERNGMIAKIKLFAESRKDAAMVVKNLADSVEQLNSLKVVVENL